MDFKDIIRMGLGEYLEQLRKALDGLTPEERRFQPGPEAHHIDFTVWHMARVEDRWVQDFARRTDTVWKRDGWPRKLGFPEEDHGYGYTARQVAELPRFDIADVMTYYDAARAETLRFLDGLTGEDLDRRPDPERRQGYTVGRMFSHVLVEESQHVGQVSYLPGAPARARQVRQDGSIPESSWPRRLRENGVCRGAKPLCRESECC